jgi:hypothetical protein
MQKALLAREGVAAVRTFYPFEYEGLHEGGPWDVVVIEGWFPMINAFIHEVCLCVFVCVTVCINVCLSFCV